MGYDLLSMQYNEILTLVTDASFPAFRAKQLYSWLNKGASFDEMTNLPAAFKDKLISMSCFVSLPKIVKKLVSSIDGTVKYLFSLSDGQLIEGVVMKYEHGNTMCISCQAGCRMGCKFCASTLGGLERSLTASEMLGQVFAATKDLGERISNIVMMGIGEPLDNYDNVIDFLHAVNREEGLNIGYRHISLSTCGLVDGIKRLSEEQLPITLSISLHNIDTEDRKRIMPITNKWSVEELLTACADYFKVTGRRISFEYTLIAGENDTEDNAVALANGLKKYLKGMPIHVNLIPLNDVSERAFKRSSHKNVEAFKNKLVSLGVNATVRRRLGPDINASCGQLRLNSLNENG